MTLSSPLYLVGAGGVGREVLEIARATNAPVAGFLDERAAGTVVCGIPVRAPVDVHCGRYLVAIGDAGARLRLAVDLDANGLSTVTMVHPSAVVASDVGLGGGTMVGPLVTLSCAVDAGDHCQVHYNVTIGHDTCLDDGVTVLPGANVAGKVTIGRGATIGSGAVVLQGLTVGAAAMVGAGAVVTRDVSPGDVVVGSPARAIQAARGQLTR